MPKFEATIMQDESVNGTGIPVPHEVVEALASGKRPKVSIGLNGYTYRTTVAVYSDEFFVPLAKVHREAAGVQGGDRVNVMIELDSAPRVVDVPRDFAAALKRAGVRSQFDALSYTRRKEHVCAIEEAKAPATRARRIEKAVATVVSTSK
jgi:hypothetical protein